MLRNILILLSFVGPEASGQIHKMDSIFSYLPTDYRNGLVGYYPNDSTIFVFKATDYLELAEFDSIPKISGDSADLIAYYSLIKTLNAAVDSGYTEVSPVMYRNAQLFPNSIILMKLFLRKKAFIFSIKDESLEYIEYRPKKSKGVFRTLGKNDSRIYYEIVYKNIERK